MGLPKIDWQGALLLMLAVRPSKGRQSLAPKLPESRPCVGLFTAADRNSVVAIAAPDGPGRGALPLGAWSVAPLRNQDVSEPSLVDIQEFRKHRDVVPTPVAPACSRPPYEDDVAHRARVAEDTHTHTHSHTHTHAYTHT